MVNNHPPIATPFNNFCPKTLSNQARDKKVFNGFIHARYDFTVFSNKLPYSYNSFIY